MIEKHAESQIESQLVADLVSNYQRAADAGDTAKKLEGRVATSQAPIKVNIID